MREEMWIKYILAAASSVHLRVIVLFTGPSLAKPNKRFQYESSNALQGRLRFAIRPATISDFSRSRLNLSPIFSCNLICAPKFDLVPLLVEIFFPQILHRCLCFLKPAGVNCSSSPSATQGWTPFETLNGEKCTLDPSQESRSQYCN